MDEQRWREGEEYSRARFNANANRRSAHRWMLDTPQRALHQDTGFGAFTSERTLGCPALWGGRAEVHSEVPMTSHLLVLGDGTYVELDAEPIIVEVTQGFLEELDTEHGGNFPVVPDCEDLEQKLEGVLIHVHVQELYFNRKTPSSSSRG